MAHVNVTIRVDQDLKEKADALYSEFGITFNAAVNMFLSQSVREQRIPFEIRKNVPITMISDEELDKISKRFIEKDAESYKELAK